ncbi:MAG: hypothetical protein LBL90_03800 [Prevotellaceae bacterium]|nr:hypothetical protein [Prevotellaceae bacterium]
MRNLHKKECSTLQEGSFGTEKEHYPLDRVKARTKQAEILRIFFGIHTANVVRTIPKVESKIGLSQRADQKQAV